MVEPGFFLLGRNSRSLLHCLDGEVNEFINSREAIKVEAERSFTRN